MTKKQHLFNELKESFKKNIIKEIKKRSNFKSIIKKRLELKEQLTCSDFQAMSQSDQKSVCFSCQAEDIPLELEKFCECCTN